MLQLTVKWMNITGDRQSFRARNVSTFFTPAQIRSVIALSVVNLSILVLKSVTEIAMVSVDVRVHIVLRPHWRIAITFSKVPGNKCGGADDGIFWLRTQIKEASTIPNRIVQPGSGMDLHIINYGYRELTLERANIVPTVFKGYTSNVAPMIIRLSIVRSLKRISIWCPVTDSQAPAIINTIDIQQKNRIISKYFEVTAGIIPTNVRNLITRDDMLLPPHMLEHYLTNWTNRGFYTNTHPLQYVHVG